MMNIGAHHPLAFHQGFWSFPGCGVHPAFLQSQYSNLHAHHTGSFSSKSSAFTIDAILNRDHVEEKQIPSSKSSEVYTSSHGKYKDSDEVQRRQQRLFEASHPYLSPKDKVTPIKKVTEFYGKNYFFFCFIIMIIIIIIIISIRSIIIDIINTKQHN